MFVSILPIPIHLLSNLRQDDSRMGSVPWQTSVHDDMVEFTDHGIFFQIMHFNCLNLCMGYILYVPYSIIFQNSPLMRFIILFNYVFKDYFFTVTQS